MHAYHAKYKGASPYSYRIFGSQMYLVDEKQTYTIDDFQPNGKGAVDYAKLAFRLSTSLTEKLKSTCVSMMSFGVTAIIRFMPLPKTVNMMAKPSLNILRKNMN